MHKTVGTTLYAHAHTRTHAHTHTRTHAHTHTRTHAHTSTHQREGGRVERTQHVEMAIHRVVDVAVDYVDHLQYFLQRHAGEVARGSVVARLCHRRQVDAHLLNRCCVPLKSAIFKRKTFLKKQ